MARFPTRPVPVQRNAHACAGTATLTGFDGSANVSAAFTLATVNSNVGTFTKLTVNGKEYLLELPLRADVALLYAAKADKMGNLVFNRSARNFNTTMALAADCVIAEVGEIVEAGEIDPDEVMVPGIVVDLLVLKEEV